MVCVPHNPTGFIPRLEPQDAHWPEKHQVILNLLIRATMKRNVVSDCRHILLLFLFQGSSQSLSRIAVSSMAAEGDIIFTRRHASNTDLTMITKDIVTSSTPATQRSPLMSLFTTYVYR